MSSIACVVARYNDEEINEGTQVHVLLFAKFTGTFIERKANFAYRTTA